MLDSELRHYSNRDKFPGSAGEPDSVKLGFVTNLVPRFINRGKEQTKRAWRCVNSPVKSQWE